ncbi:MAG: cysteine desulfurase NifS [Planctomycetes bacterium]|nr:cysteine desulfurase NifS [Planctomycetota bacterium]
MGPAVRKVIYLDNNATTRVAPEVIEAMRPFFGELYGNASSMHSFGGQVRRHVERAREQVAALLGADPSEIVFTSCGTESDNAALRGTVEALAGRKHHAVTTRVEHPAVLSTCRYLANQGCRLTELPVDREGLLDLQLLEEMITDDTAIVSVMWANNETGVVFPIEEIAAVCQRKGVVFHTDAVQVVGKLPVDLRRTPLDLLALSGHKLHAPKGVGVLYVRKGTRLAPFVLGGHQESGKRAGTENVPYIVGLGAAAELAAQYMREEVTRVRALRDRIEAGILANCPDSHVNGRRDRRLPNTANIGFEFVEGESILLMLDELGVCASSGSACTSGSLEPSHVLRAMGVPFTAAHGSIRFSLSRYNTQDEIDFVVEHMPPIIHRLRELSPFVPKGKA